MSPGVARATGTAATGQVLKSPELRLRTCALATNDQILAYLSMHACVRSSIFEAQLQFREIQGPARGRPRRPGHPKQLKQVRYSYLDRVYSFLDTVTRWILENLSGGPRRNFDVVRPMRYV